jgi:glycerol-3-phosphate acyltransferase PlsY
MLEAGHFWFNVIEAGIWVTLATRFLLYALRRPTSLKKAFLVFSTTLFLFGLSDVIETQTGAWYRPWGLFLMKAICVILILGCLIIFFRNRSECERVMNEKPPKDTEKR